MKLKHLMAAAAIAGFLGFGGISLANAQEDPTTTTTPSATDEDTSPAYDDANCPNMGDSSDSSTDSSTATSGL